MTKKTRKILFTVNEDDVPPGTSIGQYGMSKAKLVCRDWPFDHDLMYTRNDDGNCDFFFAPKEHMATMQYQYDDPTQDMLVPCTKLLGTYKMELSPNTHTYKVKFTSYHNVKRP